MEALGCRDVVESDGHAGCEIDEGIRRRGVLVIQRVFDDPVVVIVAVGIKRDLLFCRLLGKGCV